MGRMGAGWQFKGHISSLLQVNPFAAARLLHSFIAIHLSRKGGQAGGWPGKLRAMGVERAAELHVPWLTDGAPSQRGGPMRSGGDEGC